MPKGKCRSDLDYKIGFKGISVSYGRISGDLLSRMTLVDEKSGVKLNQVELYQLLFNLNTQKSTNFILNKIKTVS